MLAVNSDNQPLAAKGESLAEATLQRNHSRARKARLLLAAAQHFCELKRPAREDTEIFRELFYQLIEGCGKSDRRAISAALARNPYCPRPILIYLALETPDIAAPVLLFSQALNETDIVTLANRFPKEHLKILCRRLTLTEPAARAIALYGGAECADLLAKNAALAQPSSPQNSGRVSATLPPSMETAGFDATRQRQEADLREQVVRLAGVGGRTREKAPANGANSNQGLAIRLKQAFRQGGADALAKTIEDRFAIPARKTKAILGSGKSDSLGVLFRGLGFGPMPTLQLILLVIGSALRSRDDYDAVKSMIAGLPAERCRAFLAELGARFDTDIAAAPLRLSEAISSRRKAIADGRKSMHAATEREMRDAG